MQIGLKIDVDTFRGTRLGTWPLARLLAEHHQRATFYFSTGPDNMGRHLLRLAKPAYLWKMLHSNAPRLYGWEILLCGTFGPGPEIARRFGHLFREIRRMGHETGLHAWDHHGWQAHALNRGDAYAGRQLHLGMQALNEALGDAVTTTAAPGWQINDNLLLLKESLACRYHSDCRGKQIFRPLVYGRPLATPQIPTTLPTYDELIGRNGITASHYNDHLLSLLQPDALAVLCIHAEVEGIACFPLFLDFLKKALAAGHTFCALEDLLPTDPHQLPAARIELRKTPGRQGPIAQEADTAEVLHFRPVRREDAQRLLNWANDPALQRVSFRTQKPITWEEHLAWFEETLTTEKRRAFIAERPDGSPIGSIRFEQNHLGETEISVYLTPDARGKKLSRPLLNEGTRQYLVGYPQDSAITAWIRLENTASLAAFQSAGWTPDSAPAEYLHHPAQRFQFTDLPRLGKNGRNLPSIDKSQKAGR